MTGGLINKLTNFLAPMEDAATEEAVISKPNLTVHTNGVTELKVLVAVPRSFDDVQAYAERLKAQEAIIINYEYVDENTQQRIGDFLNGVCYVMSGGVQRISMNSVIYAPNNVDINKELYGYSVPPYMKQS